VVDVVGRAESRPRPCTYGSAPLLADHCADWIADRLQQCLSEHPTASLALSGGSSPTPLFQALAARNVAWDRVHIFQVDERLAPDGSADRNATQLHDVFLGPLHHPASMTHLVDAGSLRPSDAIAHDYEVELRGVTGGRFDVVHLGLGDDGHTASLVPGDALLGEATRLVGATGIYHGNQRVSLTYPALAMARHIAWFAVGAAKAPMVRRLRSSDPDIPAGRVVAQDEMIFADSSAEDR
jgi:6-phosphogluconolactonase